MQRTETRYLPQVDELACTGHGECVEIAPQVFQMDGDIAEVIGDGPADLILKAAEACPSVAIAVIDASSGAQLYP